MPHSIERASSGRAACRGCGAKIAAKEWRLGERLPNPFADGEGAEMTHWYHLTCGAFRRPEAFLEALAASTELGDLDERAMLGHEAALGITHRRLPRVNTADHAPTGRATCRACKNLIEQGAWRIGLMFYEDGRWSASGYIHASCAGGYLETTAIRPRLTYFSPSLTETELGEMGF
jgi:hypothetical protein